MEPGTIKPVRKRIILFNIHVAELALGNGDLSELQKALLRALESTEIEIERMN